MDVVKEPMHLAHIRAKGSDHICTAAMSADGQLVAFAGAAFGSMRLYRLSRADVRPLLTVCSSVFCRCAWPTDILGYILPCKSAQKERMCGVAGLCSRRSLSNRPASQAACCGSACICARQQQAAAGHQ